MGHLRFPLTTRLGSVFRRPQGRRSYGRLGLHALGLGLAFVCLVPFLVSLSASLSDEIALGKYGYSLWPRVFSTAAYALIFKSPEMILRSYGVSLFVTLAGTLLSMAVMVPFAFALSRTEFRFRRAFSFYLFFTMVFSGGVVPWYLLIKQYLHLDNTIWVMIVPFLVNGFTVIILRANFATTPQEILDSARIDGAGEWRTLLQIVIPLNAPTIAALSIFLALDFWNSYYAALLFVTDRNLYPLQYTLYILQTNLEIFLKNPHLIGVAIPSTAVRFAMVVLIGLPVMVIAWTFQRYFVKGVYLGGVKE